MKTHILYIGWGLSARGDPVFKIKGYRNREDFGIISAMEAMFFRRCLVACWTFCAALGACGGSTYYVIDLAGGPNAESYPMEILDGEPSGGWTIDHKTTKLVLRRIEAGTFMMCNQVSVTLTRSFFIGVFEVTSAQYAKVMGGNGNACPKAGISYNTIRGNSSTYAWPGSANVDSSTFIGKLRAKTGISTIDLPTEAQWEYACRAGTTSEYNNGGNTENDLKQLGRYDGNGDDERGGDEYYYTETIVGSYDPNNWGLYDMHGNVREWCIDYRGSLTGGVDPVGATSGNWRVMRGGGYESQAATCKSSCRESNNPVSATGYDGFRIACFPAEIVHSSTPYDGVYDGEGHGIAVDVVMPTNAVTSYALSENGSYQTDPILFTNATDGAVTVWYKVEANGYDTVTNNSTVTINKAAYDMSGVAWNYDEPFESDGTEKTVSLLNLPAGVTATYTGNAATAPGEYTAHATLAYDTVNYLEPVVADLTWTITRPTTMGDFVNCPDLNFSTSGNADWYMVENESPDGFALRSGTIAHSQTSRLDVVISGPGTVSFWCRVEGEEFRGIVYDGLAFCVDGERQGDGLINSNEWVQLSFEVLGKGSHTLSWLYVKDDSGDGNGADCAWLDTVTWTSATEEEPPRESFDGFPVTIEPDGEGGWVVTLTNDVDSADLPIEIPDNLGGVTLDLNGHDLVGDGKPAIKIVPGEGDGESTVLMVTTTGGDAMVKGGDGGAGNPAGNGAPAIEVADGARDDVLVNIGTGVTVLDGAPATGPEHTLNVGEYFYATLTELGYDVPTNGTPYSVVAKGLPAGLKLKYNAAVTKKNKNGKKVVVTPAKVKWWIEGVPTAALDFFENPPYLVIATNGVTETHALPMEVLAQEVVELPDLELGQSMNTNGWLAGVGAGWTVSGLPKGLKYATKKVTKKSGKKTVTVAEAYAVYGKTTKAGLFTVTAKKKVTALAARSTSGTYYETKKYRVLVRPKAVDEALFGEELTNITTMAYVPVAWNLMNGGEWDGGHAGLSAEASAEVGCVTLPSIGQVAKVTGLPTGLAFAAADTYSDKKKTKLKQRGQTIEGTPTKPGTYVVTFTKNVTTGTGKKKKTVAKTAQILWKVEPNDTKVELGFNEAGGVIESGMVGLKYGDLMAFTATSNATVTASGLPAGVKLVRLEGGGRGATALPDGTDGRAVSPMTAVWGFEGYATKAGTYLVTVTATVKGNVVRQRVALVVEGLPDWAKGTFNGIVSRTGCQPVQGGEENAQAARSTNGLATVTVSAAGKISGKFQEGGSNWTFSAACYTGGGRRDEGIAPYQAFVCSNVVAKYAYKVTETVKGKKKTVTKYVERTFALTVEETGPYGGVATMTEGGGSSIEAWQNLWGRADYKAVGKKFFYTSKKVPYRTFKVEVYVDGENQRHFIKAGDDTSGLTHFLALSLKVTPNGAVTATMSYDTGKTKKDPKTKKMVAVIYKATCQTVVLPTVAADAESFDGGALVYFAPAANGFGGVADWVAVP